MDVSNSTGQNTDYRVASGGGSGSIYKPPSLKGKLPLHRLGSKRHHKNVRPPAGGPPWTIEFFKAGTQKALATAELGDASCLVILVSIGKEYTAVVSMPESRGAKPHGVASSPSGKSAGASTEAGL